MLQPGNTRWLHPDSDGSDIPSKSSLWDPEFSLPEKLGGSLIGSLEDKLKGAAFPWLVIDLQNSRMALAKGRVRSGDGR